MEQRLLPDRDVKELRIRDALDEKRRRRRMADWSSRLREVAAADIGARERIASRTPRSRDDGGAADTGARDFQKWRRRKSGSGHRSSQFQEAAAAEVVTSRVRDDDQVQGKGIDNASFGAASNLYKVVSDAAVNRSGLI